MSKISETFGLLKAQRRAAFMPFLVAGDPDIATTAALIKAAAAAGADLIELGVPFSDPIADGPVIQASYYRALDKGFRVSQLFELMSRLRAEGVTVPVVCMVSQTLVFKRTASVFFESSRKAGFDGLIIPDLPAGYEGDASAQAAQGGLDLIFLIAPTTQADRRSLIARKSQGFIYYISTTGITGARAVLPEDLGANVKDIQSRTATPVCVGFGVSKPDQAAAVAKIADGVIVGSALVKRTEEGRVQGLTGAKLVDYVAVMMRELAEATHNGRG